MPKYTDEQIKKALKCCTTLSCDKCEKRSRFKTATYCRDELLGLALDLTNRYEAEIERLLGVIATITKDRDMEHKCHLRLLNEIKTTKFEAIKEFAEQVKMAFYYEFDELIPSIMADKIDNLLKEMVGEGK